MNSTVKLALLAALLAASTPAFAGGEKSPATGQPIAHESPDWATESKYWHDEYPKSAYHGKHKDYALYEPAYKYGYDTYRKNSSKRYEDLNQAELRDNWTSVRGSSTLSWEDAQPAFKDSYNRAYTNKAKQ